MSIKKEDLDLENPLNNFKYIFKLFYEFQIVMERW